MEKTWTVKMIVENEKGEEITTYKYINVANLEEIDKISNIQYLTNRMLGDLIREMKREGWL